MRQWMAAAGLVATGALARAAIAQPIVTAPRLLSGPTDEEIAAAWPTQAKGAGVSGEARIECQAPSSGDLRGCKVLLETPSGQGFGEAALALTPKFKVVPATNNTRPVDGVVRFILQFPPGRADAGAGTPLAAYTLPQATVNPTAEEIYAAWPRLARSQAVEGSADLSCVINLYGEVKDCQVVRESKPNLGFGQAAVELTRKMRFLPGTKDAMSVATRMTFRVPFECGDKCIPMRIPPGFRGEVVAARWTQTPTAEDVAAAYPQASLAAKVTGRVMLFCVLKDDGGVRDCRTTSESPADAGFGGAALMLSRSFRTTPNKELGGKGVQIPITFSDAAGVPLISRRPSGGELQPMMDIIGKLQTVDQASVIMTCRAASTGALNDCKVDSESPPSAGLGTALVQLAPKFEVSLWGENGRPTAGSIVRVPFRIDVRNADQKPEPAQLVVENPDWERKPKASDMERVYPEEALAREISGVATLKCKVHDGGDLFDCLVASETPPKLGFGAAALKLVPVFKMKPPMINGAPGKLEGTTVTVPIMFRLL